MRHDLTPLQFHGVIPPRLGRAVYHNVLVIAGTLVLTLLVMLASLALQSLPARAADEIPAGLFFRTSQADSALEAPLLNSDVTLQVNGMVTRVTLRQAFHNPTDRWQEGVYVFPLPERAAVNHLVMEIGERRVEGRILEKAEAERAYREAADNGQRASLVSGERPNVFVTALANIGPGEIVTVEIGYDDAVAYENGVFSLRFPMVVAPRYSPLPGPAEVAEAPTAPAPRPGLAALGDSEAPPRDFFGPVDIDSDSHNPLSLRVDLNAGLALAAIDSLYHPVAIESRDDAGQPGRQTVTLRDGAVAADRDFVLQWRPVKSHLPQAAVFAEQIGDDTHLLVMMVPPPAATPAVTAPEPRPAPLPREVIFVVDTSGSMHGDSLEQAKQALTAALKRLKPEDRFNVIQFNSQTFALFAQPRPATAAAVAKAWHYVASLAADGGTEMRPALELALDGEAPQGHLRQVVFLTDGAVGNEEELFRILSARLGEGRLFTVGIGAAPNSYFMRKSAELGRGSFTHIGDLGEVKPRMDALLAKLEQPALTDLRIGWPLGLAKRAEIYPAPLPDLYAGEPLTFTARLQGIDLARVGGQLLVTGSGLDGAWQQRLALDGLTPAPGTAAVWARAKLAQIEDGLYRDAAADRTAIRAEALALALDHQLVSRYTSLVAIDAVVARPEGESLATAEIARDLPAGWDAGKVFGAGAKVQPPLLDPTQAPQELRRQTMPAPLMQQASAAGRTVTLPQTATPAERMAIIGGAYVLLSLGLLALVLRRARKARRRG